MIQYTLVCENTHRFDAWFRSAAAFEQQREAGIVTCPVCDSHEVTKALMAPAVARPKTDKMAVAAGQPDRAKLIEALRALKRKVVAEGEYVGDRFAEEARRIHFEEVPARGIYGEASRDEVTALLDDGVEILPLPDLPEEQN